MDAKGPQNNFTRLIVMNVQLEQEENTAEPGTWKAGSAQHMHRAIWRAGLLSATESAKRFISLQL